MNSTASTTASMPRTINPRPLGAALVLVLGLTLFLWNQAGWRQAALFGVGLFAGVALYHAAFGFTSAWREFLVSRYSGGLRAQMLMLALTTVIFLPIISQPELFGSPVRGSVAPFGLAVLIGAGLFGIGMQLAGGCASGTLYTVGGGNLRMVVSLFGFIAGSLIGTWHAPAWEVLPDLGRISLLEQTGLIPALGLSLAMFMLVSWGAGRAERRRYGRLQSLRAPQRPGGWVHGPWPLLAGAVALAVVNVATLALAGRPWGVTSAFALWGAKAAAVSGIEVAQWPYWQGARGESLASAVWFDVTSVMNVGIMAGALAAAALAGRYAPSLRVPLRALAAALLGGLLLGYGARMAYGCNIGAFFSGIASSSLHGWLWFAAALGGNALGTRLRPWFGLGTT